PEGRRIALANPELVASFRAALPGFTPEDVPGSPYCVRRYAVDPRLGGPEGLAAARRELSRRGIRLLLDLVPNHVAPDHPWAREHPEYFVRGTDEDLARAPEAFLRAGGAVVARGRDPYFPPWPDVLQLDAFSAGYRRALADTLLDLARQCDGVRVDMAMLLVNRVFARTWGARVGPPPARELWEEVLSEVRSAAKGFLVIAEAYWDMEWELQQLGFDFCYDKRLYDRLVEGSARSVRDHLGAGLDYQEKLVRFVENHDEPRAAAALGERARAGAVAVATLPGARLFHEGQFEGRRVRLPVFLGRRPEEPVDEPLQAFYRALLAEAVHPVYRDGAFARCPLGGWPDNPTTGNLVAWCWRLGEERRLVVLNLAPSRSQGLVRPPWPDLGGRSWRLADVRDGAVYERAGQELADQGLFVDLEGWGWHLLRLG
ncbi:MAG TPA: alpha-amylase family glycosyl hydrolase, partial [Anaeromyxobacter sp.]|nr:alpha-amylase family glycosyl hydrolase [Anaeromyxobacter sp.]